jgi:3-oxoacyl-[acyl-carrier protein] reductase
MLKNTGGWMLKNKVAVITGGSRGIGYAIAHKFADNGASLMLVALHEEGLSNARKEICKTGGHAEILSGDIAEPDFSQKIVAKTLERFGTIDILVNCAGIITRTPVDSLTLEEWHRVINVNLHGTFYLSQAVLPILCKKKYGKIINITSQMARLPHPNASPSYAVSKAGMVALTRHLAYHYAQYNICINAIAPGSIDTDLVKTMPPEARQRFKNAIPLQRLGNPEEVGDLALFLASDNSNYITGATMNISGGSLMD